MTKTRYKNVAGSDPVIIPIQVDNYTIYYLIWYNYRVTLHQIFVWELYSVPADNVFYFMNVFLFPLL